MHKRILVATYIAVFVFIVLFFRLWYLQVLKGGEYKNIAEHNRLRIIDIPAPRGIVYDRNGIALVKNIPSFDISVVLEDLPKDSATLSALGKLIGLKPADIRKKLESVPSYQLEPVKLKKKVSFEEIARVEAGKIDFPGLQVDIVVSREYIYGKYASHVMGYLGRITTEQIRRSDYRSVPKNEFIGQWGVEKVYDRTLRGEAGKKIIEVDAAGRITRVVGIKQPVKGSDIQLTIDINLQKEAENALRNKVGAIVALDPNSGEVLALVSAPSFDPNLFSRGISTRDWERLVNNDWKPFLNRTLQSHYPPGSTFKVITAISALEEGIISKDTRVECTGSINFGREFRCWKEEGHGNMDLYRAIVESCDVYFYEIGKKLGIDTLARYASDFGLGELVGIELDGEKKGVVPSTEWKLKNKKDRWYTGETLNAVIGQGYLSATPIQMARLTAALVNGGKLYRPHILKDASALGPERETGISPETMSFIKKALLGVVEDKGGTGWMARSRIVRIGGKTGTTQVIAWTDPEEEVPDKYKDHAWFIAFAPEDEPQIVVTVFVEHGGQGSTVAAPIAKRVIEAYFERNAD